MNRDSKHRWLIIWAVGLALVSACGRPARPLFPPLHPPLVWPPAPDIPRIRYVGELRGEESLGAARSGWQLLRESLTGEKSEVLFSTPTAVAVRGPLVAVADGQQRAVFLLDLAARTIKPIRTAGPSDFAWPIDVTFVGDAIAVADSRRAAVFLLNLDGALIRTIGHGTLRRPSNLAFDARQAELWVLDAALHTAIAFALDGRELRRLGANSSAYNANAADSPLYQGGAGGGSATEATSFNFPAGLAFHPLAGLVVADSMNFRVLTFSPPYHGAPGGAGGVAAYGAPRLAIGKKGDAAGDFALPRDVAVDSEGHLYVLDNQFENVQIFDDQGRLLMAFGEEGRGPGQFALPSGIAIDENDRIWIADTYNRRIQVFQYLKEVSP